MGKKQNKKNVIQKLIALLKKRIKQKKKLRPKSEFRYNHDTGHMNYVFLGNDDSFRSVGLTSHDTTFGRRNMPLHNNPKKGDKKPYYVRNGIVSDSKRSYSKKTAKNYKFSNADKANVKSKIRHYKKEQKKRK